MWLTEERAEWFAARVICVFLGLLVAVFAPGVWDHGLYLLEVLRWRS